MKESDLITDHMSAYNERFIAQLSSQGMATDEELRTLILMSRLSLSRETFVMTICNISVAAMTYTSAAKDAQRKPFEQTMLGEAYVVQDTSGRCQRSRSSSRVLNTSCNRSKSHDIHTCYYCKKSKHIKAECQATKAKNEKPHRAGQSSNLSI